MKSKKKQLKELKEELEWIYQNTTKAFRQRAAMIKRIAHISDRIVELESEMNK